MTQRGRHCDLGAWGRAEPCRPVHGADRVLKIKKNKNKK